jgi:hypothetical protein
LSTISGTPALRAILAIAAISVMRPPGLAIDSMKIALSGAERLLDRGGVLGIGPHHRPAERLDGIAELVDRAAIELAAGDEFVARLHEGVEDDQLGAMARGGGESRGAAFKGGAFGLEHRLGRVHDAGVDITESAQGEQVGGVFTSWKT